MRVFLEGLGSGRGVGPQHTEHFEVGGQGGAGSWSGGGRARSIFVNFGCICVVSNFGFFLWGRGGARGRSLEGGGKGGQGAGSWSGGG